MKVYKVVRNDGRKLLSAVTWNRDFETEYHLTGWTYPKFKGSRLFVFDTLENAKAWAAPEQEIWECETKKTFECIRSWSALAYWKNKLAHKKVSDIAEKCQIVGSLMVDKVKLLRKVG